MCCVILMHVCHVFCSLVLSDLIQYHDLFTLLSLFLLPHVSAPLHCSTKQSTSREPGHNHHHQQQQSGQGFLPLPASTPVPDFTTEPIDPNEPTYCLCSQVTKVTHKCEVVVV